MAAVGVLLTVINIALGVLAAGLSLYCYRMMAGVSWRWVKMLYALVSLYWAGLNLYSLAAFGSFRLVGGTPTPFEQVFILPAFTFTMAAMAVGAISRFRSGKGCS